MIVKLRLLYKPVAKVVEIAKFRPAMAQHRTCNTCIQGGPKNGATDS